MKLHPQFRLNGQAYRREHLLEAAKQWQSSEDIEQKGLGVFLEDWLNESTTVTLQTSGSTGTPKPHVVTKAAMQTSAERTASFFALSAGDTALLCLPIRYIAGKMMVVRAMVIGLKLDVIAPKTTLQLGGNKYDFAALIPLQARASFDQLGNIKTVLLGGAPIPIELRKALATTHPHCVETYGMTETLTHVATRPVRYPAVPFQAMPDIILEADAQSCLILTVPYISETPMVTNDVVKLVAKRSFHLLGRQDFVINSGGKKIFPELLEEKLGAFLNIPFFFAGVPDKVLGEKLVLIVEGSQKTQAESLVIAKRAFDTDKHHVPKEVLRIDAFVFTKTGKLDRAATLKKVLGVRPDQ